MMWFLKGRAIIFPGILYDRFCTSKLVDGYLIRMRTHSGPVCVFECAWIKPQTAGEGAQVF